MPMMALSLHGDDYLYKLEFLLISLLLLPVKPSFHVPTFP